MVSLFDENEFIKSIVYDNDNVNGNDYEKALYDKYSNEIVFGSKKEKEIYSKYEKTFIIDIDFNDRVMIQMSFNKDIIFIEIWIEELGRKKNTYISGWLDDNMKEHIKYIKKHKGCNGTIKKLEDNKLVVMFQGNQIKQTVAVACLNFRYKTYKDQYMHINKR